MPNSSIAPRQTFLLPLRRVSNLTGEDLMKPFPMSSLLQHPRALILFPSKDLAGWSLPEVHPCLHS